MDDHETLISIDAPHFNAGLVLRGTLVIEAAPIIRYMRGWDLQHVKSKRYCQRKSWTWQRVNSSPKPHP